MKKKEPIIEVINGELSDEELEVYVANLKDKYGNRVINKIIFTVDGDFVDAKCEFGDVAPFDRIRRITGYLVGTLNRFNNGKRAEEKDRVKHSISD